MGGKAFFRIGLAVIAWVPPAAQAAPVPGAPPLLPPRSSAARPDEPKPPYAMSYAEEAAQTLGMKDGHMDLFASRQMPGNPLVPTFSGGVDGQGAMLRLKWTDGR